MENNSKNHMDQEEQRDNKYLLLEQKVLKLEKLYYTNLQSTSYQLGHLLLHETRSLRSFIALPKKVFHIWKHAKHRSEGIDNQGGSINIDLSSLNTQNSNPKLLSVANLKNLKIACIMDTFTFSVFEPEAILLQLTPQSWENEIETFQADMLLVESAWRGKDDLWRDKVHNLSQELADIIVYCRKKGIATVFWNKEDPFHFNDLIDTIQYFDFVFTTDINCIPEYKSILGHENIFLLPFACQPKIHNPIEKFERKDAFVFAGAYYPHFPERMKVFEDFIEHLSAIGKVEIYDRHFGNTNTSNIFPKKYYPLIRGTLAYNEIDKAYKGYKYAINLNSITNSPTMFSRRVFELIASNTLVLSNYAKGIPYLFGDLVIATDSGDELIEKFLAITETPNHEKKIKLLTLRKVLLEHTAENRLAYLTSKVYQQNIEISLPHLTLVSYAKDQETLNKVYEIFHRQAYNNKYLIVVLSETFDPDNTNHDKIHYIYESENKNFSEIDNPSEYIAGIIPDDYYGENYLLDLALATHYNDDVSIIGKGTYYSLISAQKLLLENADLSYHIVKSIPARSSIIKKEEIGSQNIAEWVQTLSTQIYKNDNILSIDEFNYCRNPQKNIFTNKDIEFVSDLDGINTGMEMNTILQTTEHQENI